MKNEKRKVKSGRFAQPEVLSEAEGTRSFLRQESFNNVAMSRRRNNSNKS